MNKQTLINTVAESTGFKKRDVGVIVDATIETIKETLATGEKVDIVAFGKFEVKDVAARTGRNPKTGDAIEIPAKKVVKLKPSKVLRDMVNE